MSGSRFPGIGPRSGAMQVHAREPLEIRNKKSPCTTPRKNNKHIREPIDRHLRKTASYRLRSPSPVYNLGSVLTVPFRGLFGNRFGYTIVPSSDPMK